MCSSDLAIEQTGETGQAIPQALVDAYNQSIEIGAAAGDTNARWQQFANELIASGDDALVDAIRSEDSPFANVIPQELRDAINRSLQMASLETDEYNLSEFFNELLGLYDSDIELDQERLAENDR